MLATLFADYLAERRPDLSIIVADFDQQASIASVREQDVELYPGEVFGYEVVWTALRPEGNPSEEECYDDIRKKLLHLGEMHDVVIIDTPGSLMEQNLLFILKFMSAVITPFGYDRMSWLSLLDFLDDVREMNPRFKMFFILNKYNPRNGTAGERATWKAMDDYLAHDGQLCPPVPTAQELTRCNTLKLNRKQKSTVEECYSFLYDNIFGKDDEQENDE